METLLHPWRMTDRSGADVEYAHTSCMHKNHIYIHLVHTRCQISDKCGEWWEEMERWGREATSCAVAVLAFFFLPPPFFAPYAAARSRPRRHFSERRTGRDSSHKPPPLPSSLLCPFVFMKKKEKKWQPFNCLCPKPTWLPVSPLFLQFGSDPHPAYSRRSHLSLFEPCFFVLEGAMERAEGGREVPVRALVLERRGERERGEGGERQYKHCSAGFLQASRVGKLISRYWFLTAARLLLCPRACWSALLHLFPVHLPITSAHLALHFSLSVAALLLSPTSSSRSAINSASSSSAFFFSCRSKKKS